MTGEWKVEPAPELRGYVVEWLEAGRVLLSKRNRIYRASTPLGRRELVGTVAAPLWKRLVSRLRWGQRLLRFMAYNVLPLADDTVFITFGKQVGVIANRRYTGLEGMGRPCRVLRRGCALAPNGDVVWGEYVSNDSRGPIAVYRYVPGTGRAEIIHSFGANDVRHVHGIYRDPYTDTLWCVTGDRPTECRILRTDDMFETLETVGGGDETWRTVSLQFTSDAVYYASDAEFRTNEIYRLDRRTGDRTTVAQVDGPTYYSHAMDDDLFFATTAELCPSQDEPLATLWHVAPSGRVSSVCSFTKDLLRVPLAAKLFMFGTLHFPLGPGLGRETYISGVGLRGIDNQTVRLYRE